MLGVLAPLPSWSLPSWPSVRTAHIGRDDDYWAAYTSLKQPAPGSPSASSGSASQPTQVGAVYFADLKHSFALKPLGTELPGQ